MDMNETSTNSSCPSECRQPQDTSLLVYILIGALGMAIVLIAVLMIANFRLRKLYMKAISQRRRQASPEPSVTFENGRTNTENGVSLKGESHLDNKERPRNRSAPEQTEIQPLNYEDVQLSTKPPIAPRREPEPNSSIVNDIQPNEYALMPTSQSDVPHADPENSYMIFVDAPKEDGVTRGAVGDAGLNLPRVAPRATADMPRSLTPPPVAHRQGTDNLKARSLSDLAVPQQPALARTRSSTATSEAATGTGDSLSPSFNASGSAPGPKLPPHRNRTFQVDASKRVSAAETAKGTPLNDYTSLAETQANEYAMPSVSGEHSWRLSSAASDTRIASGAQQMDKDSAPAPEEYASLLETTAVADNTYTTRTKNFAMTAPASLQGQNEDVKEEPYASRTKRLVTKVDSSNGLEYAYAVPNM